ncbi:MAG: heme-binding protein [Steroidobacteraceae bacterium]
MIKFCFFLSCIASTTIALAQTPAAATNSPAARSPSLDLALEAAKTAIETCAAKEQKIGVSVLDAAGVQRVVLASDGASSRGVASSTNKAVTALNFKAATSQLAEQSKTDKTLADAIAANTNFNSRAGGVLIKVGNEIIGAMGVGGARGSEVDEACAVAGLQKVQARLK